MSDFEKLNLNKETADMEEDEAKETLSEFMEAHKQNRTAYDDAQAELEETETEFEQKLEEKEERIAEFKTERAEEAAEYVNMPADVLADRFSFSELDQIIEEAEESTEFSEEESDENGAEDDGTLTTFSDKPEKGRAEGGGTSKHREAAESALSNHGFTVGN